MYNSNCGAHPCEPSRARKINFSDVDIELQEAKTIWEWVSIAESNGYMVVSVQMVSVDRDVWWVTITGTGEMAVTISADKPNLCVSR